MAVKQEASPRQTTMLKDAKEVGAQHGAEHIELGPRSRWYVLTQPRLTFKGISNRRNVAANASSRNQQQAELLSFTLLILLGMELDSQTSPGIFCMVTTAAMSVCAMTTRSTWWYCCGETKCRDLHGITDMAAQGSLRLLC